MDLGNLNCPIMLEVKPGGAGWAEVNMHIGKDDYTFILSYIGEDIYDLIEKVYYLYPNWGHDNLDYRVMEYYDDVEIESTIDGVTAKQLWSDVPWKTKLLWNGEGTYVKWKMERPATIDDDFRCDHHVGGLSAGGIFPYIHSKIQGFMLRCCQRCNRSADSLRNCWLL